MKRLRVFLTYAVIVFLALVSALNYQILIFPNQFAPAGLNGICTMIQHLSGISLGYMSLLINVPLAIIVYLKVNKPLAKRSMIYVVCFSLFLLMLEKMDLSRIAYETENGTSTILGPLVAGIINGTCYTFLIRGSAYTGGTDFVASIIHKYRPDLNFFWIIFSINTFVAAASFFVYGYRVEPVILCILYSFMSSTVSDKLMKSGRSAVRFEIITNHPREIAMDIISKMHHSATLVPGKGMYLGKETSVLVCVVNKSQSVALTTLLHKYPNTFAVSSVVTEVVGNFKRLDKSGHLEREILDHGDGDVV